uniref:Protein Vpu n=3 Tax=Human immunodeficiency virus type 1 TaxID=11676 RepID=Q7SPT6_HV1|nr:vpu protein [Human immunodeficiency virus 1]
MQPLEISAIVALVVALILAIVVWTIVFIEGKKKLKRQRKIDWLIERIAEGAEDSGNESEGDREELSALVEMGHHAPWDVNDM